MNINKTEIDRRIRLFVETCRQLDMKITHQRMEIFRELAASVEHPDADSIYQRVSIHVAGISRDTVYRTLSTLESEGLIRKVEHRFERARYDANMDHHHHFVCIVCGKVCDFYSERLNDLPIPKFVEALGEIDTVQVQIRGICSACSNNKKKMPHRCRKKKE